MDPVRWQIRYENRILKGLGYDLNLSRAGLTYNPGLGFESRRDYTRFGDRLFWGWLPGQKGTIANHQASLYGYVYIQNQLGTTESVELAPAWDAFFKKGQSVQIKWRTSYESIRDSLQLFGVARIPAGKYRFQSVHAMYSTPANKRLSSGVEAEAGSFYDGKRVSLSISPKWAMSRYLEFSSLIQWNRIQFPSRQLQYNVSLAQLRTKVSLNTTVSADALVQYCNVSKVVSSNIRFRYNPREGNDLYLVFNQGMWTDRFEQLQRATIEPPKPILSNRTILVKYIYTFVFVK